MHIPDGFLSNRVAISLDVISVATIALAARRVRPEDSARLVPVMGATGVFVFAAQMLSFPVLGGTSGHLLGGVLLAVLLGPIAAFVTMATVIVCQALILQDGGLIAVGANTFNIGALPVLGGYGAFRLLGGSARNVRRLTGPALFAGWFSVVLSASFCALELAVSGTIPLRVALPSMAGYHAVMGVVEGALTAGVLSFLLRLRPDLLERPQAARLSGPEWVAALVFVAIPALILVLAGSSGLPDPLEKILATPAAVRGGPPDAPALVQPSRFVDYALRALVFGALLAGACAAGWLAGRRKRRT